MNYLIDTNIISEVRKGARCDPHVARWYGSIPDASLYLSVLVLGEIRKGLERIRGRDAAQARALDNWLAAVAHAFAGRIFPVDDPVAEEWGRMNAIRPLPAVDSLLAATAKVHRMTLVTRNTPDVGDLGVRLLNPFQPGR